MEIFDFSIFREASFSLIIIVPGILLGLLVRFLLIKISRFSARKEDLPMLRIFIKHLQRPLYVFVPALVIIIILLARPSERPLYAAVFKTFQVCLIFSFGWMLFKLTYVFEDFVLNKYRIDKSDNIRERKIVTQTKIIRQVVGISVIILTAALTLMTFEEVRKVGMGLLTSAGVAGIILGLAAQKTLSNVIAGIQIAITQPIRIDDAVVVEKEWGWIEEITLTYVVVKIWDWRRLVLPITYFIEKPFQNWTRSSASIIGTVFLYTDYHIPIDKLRKCLEDALKEHELWDGQVCVLQVTEAKERVLELRALMSARNSPNAWDLRCHVREKLITYLAENYPDSLPRTRALLSPEEFISEKSTNSEKSQGNTVD